MKHKHRRRRSHLAALFGFLAASCGTARAQSPPGPSRPPHLPKTSRAPPAARRATSARRSRPPAAAEVITYQVWFTRGETSRGQADQPATPRIGTGRARVPLRRPGPQEQAAEVGSQVPAGTQLLGLNVDNGVATVDLTSEFESGGGSAAMFMRIGQVVYTLHPVPDGQRRALQARRRAGGRLLRRRGRRRPARHPQGLRSLLPAILVDDPQIGERVGNPVTVEGTANVFEANVHVEIVDASGKVVGARSRPRRAEPAVAAPSPSGSRTRSRRQRVV